MSCCNPVPVIKITAINVDTATNIALMTFTGSIPTNGRFLIVVPGCRCVCINPCSTARVQLTNGTLTYDNVLARCGNYLLLGQIARHVRCGYPLHCNVAVAPANQIICLDKLCPPANGMPVSTPISVTVTMPAPAGDATAGATGAGQPASDSGSATPASKNAKQNS